MSERLDLVVRARRVVTPEGEIAGSVGVKAGRIVTIVEMDADLDAAAVVELAADEVMFPGLVDTHVHVNEPGRTDWEGFTTATQAAAAGGVTTIVDMPLNSIPPTVDVGALAIKRQAADGNCSVDVGMWGGAIPGNRDDLRPLHDAGVFGFKCFLLRSGVEEFPPLTPSMLAGYLETLVASDGLMIVHAEDAGVIEATGGCHSRAYRDFLASRPSHAEDAAIANVIEAAAQTGARVHIVHLSSAGALAAIGAARADGVRVSVETCPHYLSFTAEEVPDGATEYKCCPPIREAANREALWDGLGAGAIDFIVSDHSPCPPALKPSSGDFGAAWGGVASLQLGLAAVWTEASRRRHTLADVAQWMAERPAALVGLGAKGGIAVGCDADFSVFAPDETWVVDAARLRHRHPVTPYDGRTLRGLVRATWLRGEKIDFNRPRGRLLSREEDDDR